MCINSLHNSSVIDVGQWDEAHLMKHWRRDATALHRVFRPLRSPLLNKQEFFFPPEVEDLSLFSSFYTSMHILTFKLYVLQECFSMHAHEEVDYSGRRTLGWRVLGMDDLRPVAFLSAGSASNWSPRVWECSVEYAHQYM